MGVGGRTPAEHDPVNDAATATLKAWRRKVDRGVALKRRSRIRDEVTSTPEMYSSAIGERFCHRCGKVKARGIRYGKGVRVNGKRERGREATISVSASPFRGLSGVEDARGAMAVTVEPAPPLSGVGTALCLCGASAHRADLSTGDYASSCFENARFEDTYSEDSSFEKASFVGTVLDHSIFVRCGFRSANLKGASLRGANFRSCDMRGVRGIAETGGLEATRFEDCAFSDEGRVLLELMGANMLDCHE